MAGMTSHFRALADYNRWANRRLYAVAAELNPELLHRQVGVYFGSLYATLEHILKTDRAWHHLLQAGTLQSLLASSPIETFDMLLDARQSQDDALIAWLNAMDDDAFDQPFTFQSGLPEWQGLPWSGTIGSTLTHLFNHQTHHRGQAHSALSLLGIKEPPALDQLVKGMLGE